MHKGSSDLLRPNNPGDSCWAELRKLVGNLSGRVPSTVDLQWFEGVEVGMQWANDRLWLTMEPRTIFDGATIVNKAVSADFARERTVRRYNRNLNDLIGYWARTLAGDGAVLRALGISDGVDAAFKLGSETAYSRRS